MHPVVTGPLPTSPDQQAAVDLQRAIERTSAKRAAKRQKAAEQRRDPATGRFIGRKRSAAVGDGFVFGFWGGVAVGMVLLAVLHALHG